jgi:hypothetical protein
MADENGTPAQVAWLNYVHAVQSLLVPQTDDRPLDQYLAFRDAVVALAVSEQFLREVNVAWNPTPPDPQAEIKAALLLELQSFPRAMEVSAATSKPEEAKGWWRNMLGRASTVSGSVKDLLENLPPYAKNCLTLFKELIEIFKG